jgi:hypothetical protein
MGTGRFAPIYQAKFGAFSIKRVVEAFLRYIRREDRALSSTKRLAIKDRGGV